MTPDLPPLARCFGGEPQTFEQHWQRAPLAGHDETGTAFADLLDVAAVDDLITGRSLRHPSFRLVKAGDTIARSRYTTERRWGATRYDGVIDPARTVAALGEGATLVLQALHTDWEPLGRFCASLHQALGHPTQANAYLTPPDERGLDLHYDTHDVLVLHTAGHKRWEVYAPRFEQPLGFQHWSDVGGGEDLDDGDLSPVLDVELGPGDCLYLPRGFVHRAASDDESSLHVTIGIHILTWHHVLKDLLGPAADDVALREALPDTVVQAGETLDVAVLERQVKELLGHVDLDQRVQALGNEAFAQYAGFHGGALTEAIQPEPVDDTLVVERRWGDQVSLTERDGRYELRLADRVIRFPLAAGPALHAVLDADAAFALQDLAPYLDEASRAVVGRRLLREGVLRRVPVGG